MALTLKYIKNPPERKGENSNGKKSKIIKANLFLIGFTVFAFLLNSSSFTCKSSWYQIESLFVG